MRILSSRLFTALVVVAGWLGLLVVGFAPLASVPLDTKESLSARVLLCLPVLLVGTVGSGARHWQAPVTASHARAVETWRVILALSVLVVALDIVANTVILSGVLGRESVWFFTYLVLPAVVLSIRAAIEIRRLTPPLSKPRELL